MPRFQLRYYGHDSPDPETILARDAAEALERARLRFTQAEAERGVLWADGALLHVFVRGEGAPPDNGQTLADQLASSGVYRIEPHRPGQDG